jgi:D-3-phosphoglycerate dehydrogenase
MRPGARLINAARGELVDEEALLEALRSGHIAGAALDVFSAEPYSGPLLELDSVVVTPHLAASTEEAQDRAGMIVAEQVAAALAGGLVANAVNIPAIGRRPRGAGLRAACGQARPACDGAGRGGGSGSS